MPEKKPNRPPSDPSQGAAVVFSDSVKMHQTNTNRPQRGPSKDATVSFSDREKELIDIYAEQEGMSFVEAVEDLASNAIARRVRGKTGRRPSATVTRFRSGN